MLHIKRALDAGGPMCIEMPTGTGKTVSLLALITSYQLWKPETGKLIYCCRTVGEVSKTLEELRAVIAYRDLELGPQAPPTLALALSSRRNLCVHPMVSSLETLESMDSECRKMTAPWVREAAKEHMEVEGAPVVHNIQLCDYYENFEDQAKGLTLRGIFSLEDLKAFGKKYGICPYFLARQAITTANIIIFSYQYLINPRISELISEEFPKSSIIVFDEAHNIDNVCIDALSVKLDQSIMDKSSRNIIKLQTHVQQMKRDDAQRLQREYQELMAGLNQAKQAPNEVTLPLPMLPDDVVQEAVPKEICEAEAFLRQVRIFLDFLRACMQSQQVTMCETLTFLQQIYDRIKIEPKILHFYSSRLNKLMRTLQLTDLETYAPLNALCSFASLCATYTKGFLVIMEPYDERTPNLHDPVISLSCLDASLAIRPVINKYARIVITSGTLSPLDMLPKLLGFHPISSKSLTTTLYRQNVLPIVVSRGSDQTFLSTKYKDRDDSDIIRNYGLLLLKMCELVPDGIVCFLASYSYMETAVALWNQFGIIKEILQHKLIFAETPDSSETSLALKNYKLACDNGRGAVFLSISRGKVSEGIDFANHYGRCVIVFGIPYVYTESRVVQSRISYLKDNCQIKEAEFLTFDAMRTAAQCVGRVIRGKTDYGIMLFADKRYNRIDKRDKLPPWIAQYMGPSELNLSTDEAASRISDFLRQLAQPVTREEQIGISLWTIADVKKQPTSKQED